MVLDDYESDYETLLQKTNMSTLQIIRIKTLANWVIVVFLSYYICTLFTGIIIFTV